MPVPTSATGPLVDSLLEALRAGRSPEEGFRRLFELYRRPVHGFFARRGFSPADCQDLTQETFLGIFRGMGTFRQGAPFEAWLFAIAANTYRKRLRHGAAAIRRADEVPLPADGEGEGAAPEAPAAAPDQGALEGERRRLLKRAVKRLPAQMRSCLALRVYHDLKYREVAEAMQLSIDTVKAHLAQAKKRLRKDLGPYFDAEAACAEEDES